MNFNILVEKCRVSSGIIVQIKQMRGSKPLSYPSNVPTLRILQIAVAMRADVLKYNVVRVSLPSHISSIEVDVRKNKTVGNRHVLRGRGRRAGDRLIALIIAGKRKRHRDESVSTGGGWHRYVHPRDRYIRSISRDVEDGRSIGSSDPGCTWTSQTAPVERDATIGRKPGG